MSGSKVGKDHTSQEFQHFIAKRLNKFPVTVEKQSISPSLCGVNALCAFTAQSPEQNQRP